MSFSDGLYYLDSSGWLGLAGLLLTVIGFVFTLIGVVRSKGAAERAELASKIAIGEIQKLKTVTDLSAAISELEGVRRLLRENSISQLSERLALVRKYLIGIEKRHSEISVEDADQIRLSVSAFADTEKEIDRHLRGKTAIKFEKINDSLIDQIDRLVAVISGLT